MKSKNVTSYITPAEVCLTNVTDNLIGYTHCNATWDTITCWSPTMAGQVAKQPCPYIFGAMENSFVYKTCGSDGAWSKPEMWSGFGYSDYSECVAHLNMIDEIFDIKQGEEMNKHEITTMRSLQEIIVAEVALLAISFIILAITIIALYCALPKSIVCSIQHRIDRNFYCAILLETVLCFILKLDHGFDLGSTTVGSESFCIFLILCLEFCSCTTFMWLFLQAHCLKQSVLSGQLGSSGFPIYCLIGWGIPAVPTTVWAVSLYLSSHGACWNGYKSEPVTWILDATELIFLLAAAVILLLNFKRLLRCPNAVSNNCCFRRIFFENLACICYLTFIAVSTSLVLLQNHGPRAETNSHSTLSDLCRILVSLKGMVVSLSVLIFNADVRKWLQVRKRRIYNQHLDDVITVENTDCL